MFRGFVAGNGPGCTFDWWMDRFVEKRSYYLACVLLEIYASLYLLSYYRKLMSMLLLILYLSAVCTRNAPPFFSPILGPVTCNKQLNVPFIDQSYMPSPTTQKTDEEDHNTIYECDLISKFGET